MCHAYHYLYGTDITIFRYFTVYGPAGRPDMVMFRFTQWITEGRPVHLNGDGNQTRGFTFVDDIARGTHPGAQTGRVRGDQPGRSRRNQHETP